MNSLNPFTLLFCWAPFGLGILLPALYMLSLIAGMRAKAQAEQAKRDAQLQAAQLRQAEAARRQELQEARIAKANNDVVLQDARLELTQLRITKERKAQGLNAPPFVPEEHTPKPQE